MSLAEIARLLANPDDPEALAALVRADLPYPLGQVMWLGREAPTHQAEKGSSPSGPRPVFYTVIADGRDRLEMSSSIGAFLVAALGAMVQEEGWSEELAVLRSAAAELAAADDADDTLNGWAMGATLQEGGVAFINRSVVTGARP